MLNKDDIENIEAIKGAAQIVWGDMCEFGDIDVSGAPFCMFDLPMRLYNHFDILLEYDRSILGINLKKDNDYVNIRKFTDKEIIGSFASCKPESLLHNFKILDDVLSSLV